MIYNVQLLTFTFYYFPVLSNNVIIKMLLVKILVMRLTTLSMLSKTLETSENMTETRAETGLTRALFLYVTK